MSDQDLKPPPPGAAPPVKGPPGTRRPTDAGPPEEARRKPVASPDAPPRPSFDDIPDDASLRESSSATTWIVVILLIGLMIGGVLWAKPELLEKFTGPPSTDATATPVASAEKTTKKKKRKRRKKRKERRTGGESTTAERTRQKADDFYEDDEFWDDDDLEVEDRFAFGNVFDEPDPELPDEVPPEEPEFIPPPEMWKPSGSYSPTSRWAARGAATEDVVEISMTGSNDAAPLRPTQIRSVLTVGRLMPCYREIAEKVPGIRGRVDIKLQVEADGRPSRVSVTASQLRSKMIEDCIVKTIRGLRFPQTDGRRTRFDTHFDFD